MYFGYILRIKILLGTSYFGGRGSLNLSGSIGYLFRFRFSSDPITQNTKKQDPIGIYVGFGFIFIGSGSVRIFGFDLFARLGCNMTSLDHDHLPDDQHHP